MCHEKSLKIPKG